MNKSHTPDVQKIKKLLTGAEGRRLDELRSAQSDVPHRFRNPDSRRAATKLLQPLLKDRVTATDFAATLVVDDAKLARRLKAAKAGSTDAVVGG